MWTSWSFQLAITQVGTVMVSTGDISLRQWSSMKGRTAMASTQSSARLKDQCIPWFQNLTKPRFGMSTWKAHAR